MTITPNDHLIPPAALARRGGALSFDERPLLAIWELTQACDLACVHCRACASAERDPLELSTDEGRALIDQVAAMGTPLMVLTGGDPAKRPDLVDLIAHGTARGLSMAVTPSGTALMTRELLTRMRDAGLARLAVSVDGPDAETHDAFRRVSGSFAHSIRILDDARVLGISTQVNTSLAPHNLRGVHAMADLVTRMGAALWSVFVVVPTGRADASLLLTATALERALEDIAAVAERGAFDVKTTAAPHFRRVLLERHARRGAVGVLADVDADGNVRGPRGVNDGQGFVFVSHRGEVYPSGFLPIAAGTMRGGALAEIYRNSPLFRTLRDPAALEGKCGVCPFKRVCGGSRARAYALTGNAMGSDPLCPYVPRAWSHGESAPGVCA